MIKDKYPWHVSDDGGRVRYLVECLDKDLPLYCSDLPEPFLFRLVYELGLLEDDKIIQSDYKVSKKGKGWLHDFELRQKLDKIRKEKK